MFDIPDAKRYALIQPRALQPRHLSAHTIYYVRKLTPNSVRREELYGSDNEVSAPNDTPAQDALRAQLAALYGPIETTPSIQPPTTQPPADAEPEAGAEEEAFEFNLFAPSAPKSVPAQGDADGMTIETPKKPQKIILSHSDDEDPPIGGGKLVRQRKDGWWMADITEARRAEYRDVAVDMEDIRRWTETRWYGWEKPWKVRVIHTGLSPAELQGAARTAAIARKLQLTSSNTADKMDLDEKVKSKTKPNKKRRIILRSREKAAKEAAEQARIKAEKEREDKLNADADYAVKRNARNRERKIKRREREKRKKEAARLGVEFVEEGSDAEEEQKVGGKETVAAA